MRPVTRHGWIAAITLVGLALAGPAGAEPFVTYEDWKTSKTIRGDRWRGGASPAQDVQKEQDGHKLHMRLRREGGRGSDSGFIGAQLDMAMVNPLTVTQIEADFKIKHVTLEGCDNVPSPISTALPAQISLGKLYDGTPRLPGQRTGDHFARIRAVRGVTSPDPPGEFQVQAIIFRCQDATCASALSIPGGVVFFPDLVRVGDKFTLRLVWDPANDRFLAGLNAGPDVELPYPDTFVPTPAVPFADLPMTAAGANCTTDPGVSDASVVIGEVRTNAGAVIP